MGKMADALGRLRRRIRDWLADLEEAMAPEPELVPVPVRRPQNPHHR